MLFFHRYPGIVVDMKNHCHHTLSTCRDLMCRTHGLGGNPLTAKRFVGLRHAGESPAETEQRLYEEAMMGRRQRLLRSAA